MVNIRTYANLFEAEFAVRTLEEHGIEAHLSSEDVGGFIPSSFATGGVRLLVAESDADRAVTILKSKS